MKKDPQTSSISPPQINSLKNGKPLNLTPEISVQQKDRKSMNKTPSPKQSPSTSVILSPDQRVCHNAHTILQAQHIARPIAHGDMQANGNI